MNAGGARPGPSLGSAKISTSEADTEAEVG
jgi:hypothetical protein